MPGAAAVTGPEPMDNMKSLSEEGGQEALHTLMGLSYDDRRQFTVREKVINMPVGPFVGA